MPAAFRHWCPGSFRTQLHTKIRNQNMLRSTVIYRNRIKCLLWEFPLAVPVLVLLFDGLWFILRGDLLYVLPFVILFLCFSVLLALRLPRLEKRELILVLFVRLYDLCSFVFVGFLFLLVFGKGCGLWLWHSLDFSLTFFFIQGKHALKHTFVAVICRSTSWKRTLILGLQFLLWFYHMWQ